MIDLSYNNIETISSDDFPSSVYIIDLRENPCCKNDKYKELLIDGLPELIV